MLKAIKENSNDLKKINKPMHIQYQERKLLKNKEQHKRENANAPPLKGLKNSKKIKNERI